MHLQGLSIDPVEDGQMLTGEWELGTHMGIRQGKTRTVPTMGMASPVVDSLRVGTGDMMESKVLCLVI